MKQSEFSGDRYGPARRRRLARCRYARARTVVSSGNQRHSTITSRPTAVPARPAKADFPPSGPLSSLRFARLPVGASHADFPQAEKARECHLGLRDGGAPWQKGLGIRHRARRHPRYRQRQIRRLPTSMCSPIRIIAAAPASRCFGTRSSAPSSTTNPPKSSACSIRAFDAFTDVRTDYYPAELRGEIDRVNDLVYATVNNGVYRSGFATTQVAYEEAARAVFATLDQLEARLVAAALSGRSADHRSRLAAVYDARSFRCSLLQPLQMQRAAHHRLSQSVELSARSLSGAGQSPRPSVSITSSGTITAATATSIRPASCRSGRS